MCRFHVCKDNLAILVIQSERYNAFIVTVNRAKLGEYERLRRPDYYGNRDSCVRRFVWTSNNIHVRGKRMKRQTPWFPLSLSTCGGHRDCLCLHGIANLRQLSVHAYISAGCYFRIEPYRRNVNNNSRYNARLKFDRVLLPETLHRSVLSEISEDHSNTDALSELIYLIQLANAILWARGMYMYLGRENQTAGREYVEGIKRDLSYAFTDIYRWQSG